MSLTLYRARRSRIAAVRRGAVLAELAAVAATLILIASAAGLSAALFHL